MVKCEDFPGVVVPLRPTKTTWVAWMDLLMLGCFLGNSAIWIYLQL